MKQYVAKTALLPEGWRNNVRVDVSDAGLITRVEPDSVSTDRPTDLGARALLPAMANLHSHAFQRILSGRTEASTRDGDDFWSWRQSMYALLDALSPGQFEAISAMAYCEMLEHGYGAVAEFHYVHHASGGSRYTSADELSARIVEAARISGIGLTLLPVLYMNPGGATIEKAQTRFICEPDEFLALAESAAASAATLPDSVTGLAAHSVRAVTPEGLRMLEENRGGKPFHMHLAEQTREVMEFEARTGRRPGAWMVDEFELDSRCCLVHCTHLDPGETRSLAQSGAVAGVCPVTEANLGDGIFDGPEWLASGGTLGIGTDSNVSIGLAGELRLLEYAQRLRDRQRLRMRTSSPSVGRSLYAESLAGGASALGRQTGAIECGNRADLIAIDTGHSGLAGLEHDELLDGWIFGAGDAVITDVWSAGRHMVRDGRHVERDAIERAYLETIAALRATL